MSQSKPTAYLADANILLRLAQASHPMHVTPREAVKNIRAQGDEIMIAVQSLFEYWVVATRPTTSGDGLGLTPTDAKKGIQFFQSLFDCCIEAPIFDEWQRLVTTYNTQGKAAHDARYAAVMKMHGISHILTFNGRDFQRYAPEGIIVVDPANVQTPVPRVK